MTSTPQTSPSPIVVGYDGSPTSDKALQWAVAHSAHLDLRLVVALAENVRLDESGLENEDVQIRHVVGKAAPALLALVDEVAASLLVLGRRGRGGLASFLLGSVSDECATKAPCPVVVTGKHSFTGLSQSTIVVGVDGSPDADDALSWAAALARANSARLHVVSSWEAIEVPGDSLAGSMPFLSGETMDYLQSDAEKLVQTVVTRCEGQLTGLEVTTEACIGDPAAALCDTAAELRASLLVVGTRGVGGIRPLMLGSVARSCLHGAPCPVAVTRSRPSGQ